MQKCLSNIPHYLNNKVFYKKTSAGIKAATLHKSTSIQQKNTYSESLINNYGTVRAVAASGKHFRDIPSEDPNSELELRLVDELENQSIPDPQVAVGRKMLPVAVEPSEAAVSDVVHLPAAASAREDRRSARRRKEFVELRGDRLNEKGNQTQHDTARYDQTRYMKLPKRNTEINTTRTCLTREWHDMTQKLNFEHLRFYRYEIQE